MTRPQPEYWVTFRCVTCGEVIESERVVDKGTKSWNFDAHERARHRDDHPRVEDPYGYVYNRPLLHGECG